MRLLHAGLTVSDLSASIAFYRDICGMQEVHEPIASEGEWFGILTENEGAAIDAMTLADGPFILQLVYYREKGEREAATGHNRVGNLHLCFRVDDVHAKHAAVLATGKFSPSPIVELPYVGATSFYAKDPDGVPVEFVQVNAHG